MNIEQKIKNSLDLLIEDYENTTDFLNHSKDDSFDMERLPKIIRGMTAIVTAKSDQFSNIAAVTMSTFVLSNLFGQFRPVISDPVYSDDDLTPNFYSIILAKSGGGKDLSFNTLKKACEKASKYLQNLRLEEEKEFAKQRFIKDTKKNNPDFNINEITEADYQDFIEPVQEDFSTIGSSRGGITTSLNKLAKKTYGTKSIFSSELGMAIKTSPFASEVVELASILYDMGSVQAAEYKSNESKEESIKSMFINFMGISAPAVFYQDGPARNFLVPLIKAALARRCVFIYSKVTEELENVDFTIITKNDERKAQVKNREIISKYTDKVNDLILEAVKRIKPKEHIGFDTEASQIYDDYKGYTSAVAKKLYLNDPNSVEALEISGRAFKMGRIAAIWALASNSSMITKEIILSAIYYIDYTADHLSRFIETLDIQNYELFVSDWKMGYLENTISIDKAITQGYITAKQTSKNAITTFLNPVNSKLEGEATVTYDEGTHSFVFTSIVKNTKIDNYGYTIEKGHTDTVSIVKTDLSIIALQKILINDCTFNPFADDTTNFITLEVVNPILSMNQVHQYLKEINHFIRANEDGFLLLLPVNATLNKESYKFVVMTIAYQLMLDIKPNRHEITSLYNGYTDRTILSVTDGELYDCTGIIGNFASGGSAPLLQIKSKTKPTKAVVEKYTKEFTDHIQDLANLTNVSNTPILFLASLVYDLKCHYVGDEQILDIINAINSNLEKSINEETKNELVIKPFKDI